MAISHLPVRFGRNQMTVNVDAADEGIVNRSGLVYFCSILVPKAYLSGEFEVLATLQGSEVPPRVEGDTTVYDGWRCDIADYLDGKLEWSLPSGLISMQGGALMPYRTKTWIENNGVLVAGSEVLSAVEYVIKGGLAVNQFPAWGEVFFSKYLDINKMFLTWQPDGGFVNKTQPIFISFLQNFTPKPEKLRLCVKAFFRNGTDGTFLFAEESIVNQFSLFTLNVGFDALGLLAKEAEANSEIWKWAVFMANESDEQVSELRTFYVDEAYYSHERVLIFVNSLGGWDTLRVTGKVAKDLAMKIETAGRVLENNYLPTSEEAFVVDVLGERTLTVNTGYAENYKWIEYFEELVWSEKVFLLTVDGWISLVQKTDKFQMRGDDEFLGGRTFVFLESKEEVGYSNLPAGALPADRVKTWIPTQEYCMTDEKGVRNGMKGWAKLMQVYVDTGERVKGVAMKSNTPGTDGYYEPVSTNECSASSTPYRNASVTKTLTHRKNTCGSGFVGGVVTVTIAANLYGSEISQVDANAKATLAADALDTQEYVNENGSCVAMVNGLRGKYYQYNEATTPTNTLITWMNTAVVGINRVDSVINFLNGTNWNLGSLVEDYFCVRWTGYVMAPVSGLIRFRITSDDGCRLNVNGVQVIDSWNDHEANVAVDGSILLEAGKLYPVILEYYDYAGASNMELRWLFNSVNEVIPNANLFTEP